MILTDREIVVEWRDGHIEFVPNIDQSQIGHSSVDLRLGPTLRIPKEDAHHIIRPRAGTPSFNYGELIDVPETGYNLPPHKFVLGATYEQVKLPNYLVGRLEGKSSLARYGLMIHCTSGHIDPGFANVIVLEIYNHGPNTIVLEPQMLIAHIVLAKVSMLPSKSYSGQFAGQIGP